jgi:hypothetical protein
MTDIAIADIPAALVDIHAKLVEKLGEQPAYEPILRCDQQGRWAVILYGATGGCLRIVTAPDSTSAINQALDFIAGMVGTDKKRKLACQKSLAGVIDEAHDLNFPDAVLAPLRASSQAMTENLIGVTK